MKNDCKMYKWNSHKSNCKNINGIIMNLWDCKKIKYVSWINNERVVDND